MTLQMRLMTLDDLEQIADIEKRSFVAPWSPRTYAYEISESESSHMVVLADSRQADAPQASALMRLLHAIGYANNTHPTVLAYGGLWNLVDEGHISTIASHPEHRRNGYGEAVLAGMMMRSIILGVSYVGLEVRVTNLGAQALYRKYGFEIHGIKPKYYLDNMEDAYDMRINLTDPNRAAIGAHYHAIKERVGFTDLFTTVQHNL